MLQQSVDEFRALHDDWGLTFALFSLASAFLLESRFEEAVPMLEESIGLSRSAGTQVFLSSAQVNLGAARIGLGELDAADRTLREALRQAQDAGSHEVMARALEGLAAAAIARRDARQSVQFFGAAEAVRRSIGATIWKTDRRQHDQTMADLHAALGAAAADKAIAAAACTPLPNPLSAICAP